MEKNEDLQSQQKVPSANIDYKHISYPPPHYYDYMQDDEIDLLELWKVIWQRKIMIGVIAVISVLLMIIYVIFLPNIYQVKAVVMPIETNQNSASSGLMGMAAKFAGISMPGGSSMEEVSGILKSDLFKKQVIEKYDILPNLFFEDWDQKTKKWKQGDSTIIKYLNPRYILSQIVKMIHKQPEYLQNQQSDDGSPSIQEAIRKLNEMLNISQDRNSSALTISIENCNPEFAKKLLENILIFLKKRMSEEELRLAHSNKEYLVNQLDTIIDPIIKNKIYDLIASQVERETVAGNIENYAFKVIDSPMLPDKPVKPKRSLMVVLSAVVSVFIGIFLAFFIEYIKKAKENSKPKI